MNTYVFFLVPKGLEHSDEISEKYSLQLVELPPHAPAVQSVCNSLVLLPVQ